MILSPIHAIVCRCGSPGRTARPPETHRPGAGKEEEIIVTAGICLRPPSRGRLPQVVEATEGAFKRVGEPLAVTGSQQVKYQAGERRLYQRRLAFGVLGLDAVSDQALGVVLARKRDLLRPHITGQTADRGVQRGGFE